LLLSKKAATGDNNKKLTNSNPKCAIIQEENTDKFKSFQCAIFIFATYDDEDKFESLRNVVGTTVIISATCTNIHMVINSTNDTLISGTSMYYFGFRQKIKTSLMPGRRKVPIKL
jgi:hypothetical protein